MVIVVVIMPDDDELRLIPSHAFEVVKGKGRHELVTLRPVTVFLRESQGDVKHLLADGVVPACLNLEGGTDGFVTGSTQPFCNQDASVLLLHVIHIVDQSSRQTSRGYLCEHRLAIWIRI